MNFNHSMDALNESNIFNTGGIATIFSFFGLNAINVSNLASVNLILLVCIGFLSAGFTIMKIYREYLLTKKLKKQIKKEEEDKDKEEIGW